MIQLAEQTHVEQKRRVNRKAVRTASKGCAIELVESRPADVQFFPADDYRDYGFPPGLEIGFVVLMPNSHQEAIRRIREFVDHIRKHGVEFLPDEDGNE